MLFLPDNAIKQEALAESESGADFWTTEMQSQGAGNIILVIIVME